MRNIIGISLALGLILSASYTQAHHSFSATFTDDIIEVEGYVVDFKFVNPHVTVHFEVTDDAGETTRWVTEGGAATLLRREQWDNQTLKEGDYIRVSGNSTRNGSPMVSMEDINFVDPATGRVVGTPGTGVRADSPPASTPMQLANGQPNLSGAWTMRGGGRRNAGGPPGAGEGPPGAPGGPGRGRAAVPFNEIGAALQAVYDPVNDPQVQCEPPGLVRQAGFTPHPARIEQHDDYVVIAYEEYGSVRTIYFDDRDLVGGAHTNLGQSIARYEGDKLIVETTNLLGNLTGPGGNALTDQTTTLETYYRNPDVDGQSSLAMDMAITDPGHLTDVWTLSWEKFYNDGYEFIEVDCQKPLAY